MINTTIRRKAGIHDEVFGIKMLMSQASYKLMWTREIIKNALEATTAYIINNPAVIKDDKPVKIKVRVLKLIGLTDREYTAPKLSFLNYGGMSLQELKDFPDFFCNTDKVKDFLENFGLGVKLTTTKFTDLLYLSYKDGTAHFTVIGMNEYQELVIHEEPNECTDWVIDSAEDRGYDLYNDWTEVILLGKQEDQNTLTHLYDPRKNERDQQLIIKSMYTRFLEIPENINVVFESGSGEDTTPHGAGPKSDDVIFKTVFDIWERAINALPNLGSQKEKIYDKESGCKVTLMYDAPRKNFGEESWKRFSAKTKKERLTWFRKRIDGFGADDNLPDSEEEQKKLYINSSYVQRGIASPMTEYSTNRVLGNGANIANFSGLIWGKSGEKELYNEVKNGTWKSVATHFGIFYDYHNFKIFIELKYSTVKPVFDRSYLIPKGHDVTNVGNGNDKIEYKDYISVVKRVLNDPKAKWFVEKVKEHNAKNVSEKCDEIMDDMLKDHDFKPHENDTTKSVSSKSGSNDDSSGGSNEGKTMPRTITFSNNVLKCPKCRKNGILTDMPKGETVCSVCGYERKHTKPKSSAIKYMKAKQETPKPDFINDETLGEFWARSEQVTISTDKIFVNPKHKVIKRLLDAVEKEIGPEFDTLDSDNKAIIKNSAFEYLKASTGVMYMIAKAEAQHFEYFDHDSFTEFCKPKNYTFRAKYDQTGLKHLVKLTKKLLKSQGDPETLKDVA